MRVIEKDSNFERLNIRRLFLPCQLSYGWLSDLQGFFYCGTQTIQVPGQRDDYVKM